MKTHFEGVFYVPVLMKLLADVVMMSVHRQLGDCKDQLDKVHLGLMQHLAFTVAPHTKLQISPMKSLTEHGLLMQIRDIYGKISLEMC